jgi:ribonuclease E
VAEVTSLGLVQMTRKRIGTGLLEAFSETCEHCGGRGVVVADAPIEPKRSEEPAGRSARRSRGGRTRGGEDRPETRPENGARPAVPSPRDLAAMAKEHAASPADAAETSAPEAVGSETGVGAGVEAAGSAAAPARVEQLEPAGTPEAVETDTAWAGTLEPDTVEPEEAVVPPVGDPEAAALLDEAEAARADAAGETTDPADEPGDSAADSAGDSTGDSTDDSAGQPPADPTADRTGDATADPTGDAAAEPTPAAPEPRVVTRTRRRAASRPAGPPAAAPAKTAAPAVGEGSAASAGPATGDGPGQGGQDVETAAGVPDEDGGDHDVPHFEHVPIKRKGRKR